MSHRRSRPGPGCRRCCRDIDGTTRVLPAIGDRQRPRNRRALDSQRRMPRGRRRAPLPRPLRRPLASQRDRACDLGRMQPARLGRPPPEPFALGMIPVRAIPRGPRHTLHRAHSLRTNSARHRANGPPATTLAMPDKSGFSGLARARSSSGEHVPRSAAGRTSRLDSPPGSPSGGHTGLPRGRNNAPSTASPAEGR